MRSRFKMRSFSIISALGAVNAAETKVISCNKVSGELEMTVQLTNSYMTQFHPEIKPNFQLNGDVYERTYTPAELEIDLTNGDDLILNLIIPKEKNIIDDLIVYEAASTFFSCRYPRTVIVKTDLTVTDSQPAPHTMYGYLPYAFDAIDADNDRAAVVIKPNHGLQLETNVQECSLKYEEMPDRAVYPIHSFTDETCLDKRIDSNIYFEKAQDTGKSVEIRIDWKKFKFNGGNENKQLINIECKVRAANELSTVTPSACTCFDESSCVVSCGDQRRWTKWYDRDDPPGSYDQESLSDLLKENPNSDLCENPSAIKARVVSTQIPFEETGIIAEVFSAEEGLICKNSDNSPRQCEDFEVSFCCPIPELNENKNIEIEITASCSLDWDAQTKNGIYRAVGIFDGRLIYEKTTPDANGNWWTFRFDSSTNEWKFKYSGGQINVGKFSDEKGYESNDTATYKDCSFDIDQQ